LDLAIVRQEDSIRQERIMIQSINQPDNTANKKLIEIDTGRLRDNIDRHLEEINLFKNAIKDEEARRRDTERLIMYKEIRDVT
jgi:hypothetical protein